ncbi:MAG: metallophosphoesterase [Deltaproteobacteria bacterium]|nr:metallophosphoesterase [Deltaproteobacteria bacterium]
MKIFYTSDIHASGNHLFSMLSIAEDKTVDAIIIGGDIVPHHLPEARRIGIVEAQATYLKRVFVPAIRAFKQKQDIPIYLDLANDDFICNREILTGQQDKGLNLLHMEKHRLTDLIDIIGYMVVPLTPFQRKDWEKPDSKEAPYAKGNRIILNGYTSINGRLEKTVINLASEDTIENDLRQLSQQIERPFVFVSHSPPYDTPLDLLDNGLPVGSLSIRRFIEQWSIKGMLALSLHGHIHGSPNRSGSIRTKIEKSLCINPGQNEGNHATLRYVILELLDGKPFPGIRAIYEPGQV